MDRRPHRIVLSGLLAATLSLAPLPSPASGVYEPVPIRDRERSELIEKSDELHRYFERRALLDDDPRVLVRLREIGESLAPPPTDSYIDYRFYVLRDPSPNAFALPNGRIYVHTGMLARLEDESQLAALLAHEINHVAGHHSIVNYRAAGRRTVASMVLTGVFGGLGSLISAALYTSMYGFSRELEQEADDRAVAIIAESPYDPHALPEIFEVLAQDPEGLRPRIATVWSTHPQLEARAERTRGHVAALPERERGRAAYDALTYHARLLTVRDYIRDDWPRTALLLADNVIAAYPEEPEVYVAFGDAWQQMGARAELDLEDLGNAAKRRNVSDRIRRTRQERERRLLATDTGQNAYGANMSRARDAYLDALALDAAHAPAYRGLGDASYNLGRHRDAAQAYVDYLQHAPDAADRNVVLNRLRELRDVLRTEESQ